MKQYPHFLYVHQVSEATQDENGNWTDVTDSWVLHSVCREVTNGRGTMINGSDGKAIIFSSVVQLPSTCESIKEGTEIRACNTENVDDIRVSGKVLKFDIGQYHRRLWV